MVLGKDLHLCNTYSANILGVIPQIQIHCSLKIESSLENHFFVDHNIVNFCQLLKLRTSKAVESLKGNWEAWKCPVAKAQRSSNYYYYL